MLLILGSDVVEVSSGFQLVGRHSRTLVSSLKATLISSGFIPGASAKTR